MSKTEFSIAIICLMALSIWSPFVHAAPSWHTEYIYQVYPVGNGQVILTFVNPAPGCTTSSRYHYITVGHNGVTQEGLDNMLSVALTAAATGRQVAINYDDAHPNCAINRLSVVFGAP